MKKVLVATEKPFAPVAVEGIKKVLDEAGYEMILLEKYKAVDEFKQAAANADALIIRSDIASREVIKAAPNLKIVVRAGAGYDNIDLAACNDQGVVAMNTPGQNSNAVAELAFGMMIYAVRNGFNGTSGSELRGKKIGLHAYGNVGKYVAIIAKGFGMDVYAYDPYVSKEDMAKDGIKGVDTVEELYKSCKFISLHIPANEKTKKSIDFALMNLIPKGGMLVNTARKEVINEDDLIRMMEERPDFKYLSDISPDCLNLFQENYPGRFVLSAKKMGAQTSEANINAGIAAARQIVDFFEKGDVRFKVN